LIIKIDNIRLSRSSWTDLSIFIILFLGLSTNSCRNDKIPDVNLNKEFANYYHLTINLLDSIGNDESIEQKISFIKEDSLIGIHISDFSTIYWIKLENVKEDKYLKRYFNLNQINTLMKVSRVFMKNSIQGIIKSPICSGIYFIKYHKNKNLISYCDWYYISDLPNGTDCITERKEGNFRIIGKLNNFYFLRENCDY